MLVRRALVHGSFPMPDVRNLGATGFWNVMSSPSAAYYNGKTYIAWCNDSANVFAAEYVHSTGVLSTPVQLATSVTAVDGAIHVSPSILVRSSDHKIIVGAASNGTGSAKVWISTNAEDATAFGAGITVFASTETYCDLIELSGTIYFISAVWISGFRRMRWYKSADNGATWDAGTTVMTPAVNSSFFWHLVSNGSRIDIYATDTDRSSAPSSVYHCYWDGSVLRDSAGSSLGSLPVASNAGTLVSNASLGAAYVQSATTDAGQPVAVLFVDTGSTTLQRRASWSGSAWSLVTVVDQGGLIGTNPNIAGGAILDASTIFAPVKVGATFEMYEHDTTDGGATWTHRPITVSSGADNASPVVPRNASGLVIAWGRGSYTSDFVFSFVIHALMA